MYTRQQLEDIIHRVMARPFSDIICNEGQEAMLYGEKLKDMDDEKFLWAFEKIFNMCRTSAEWQREENGRILNMFERR